MKTGSVIPAVLDGGEWAASFGLSWTDMMLYDQAVSGRIIREGGQYLRKVCGTMGVADGRNQVLASFLKSDAEWLWFIDSDMSFHPDTVDRMVTSAEENQADVLGGLCFAQRQDTRLAAPDFHAQRFEIIPTLYEFVSIGDTGEVGFETTRRYTRDAYQAVGGTGAACLLIHRTAAETIEADPFRPMTLPGAGGKGTDRTFSEDLSFCVRAAAADLTVGVDTRIKTAHFKGGLFLDETTYAMQEETMIQAKGHEIARMAEWAARRKSGPFGLNPLQEVS